jgi:uncharacterized repeat protein (TIGR04138 family)
MQPPNFEETLNEIAQRYPRFHRDAFTFIREGIELTQKKLRKNPRKSRHITGPELLEGLREAALSQYGPMALTVLNEWGIHKCEDFGEVVFIMVEHGLLSKSTEDSPTDFSNGYSFDEAFRAPFLPTEKKMMQGVENSPQPGV